jgi:hypothetical protein
MAELNVDTSSRREQRNFGFVMAGAITVLGMVRWAFHWWREGQMPGLPIYFFAVAGVFLLLALAAPKVLEPIFVLWMKFALLINWVVTRILLTLVFVTMLIPGRGIVMLLRKDLLRRKWEPDSASYWQEPDEQPEEFERYQNMF